MNDSPPSRLRARPGFLLGALLLLGLGRAARADEVASPAVLPGESRATANRLAEARKLLDAGKWAEAVEELQAILDASGEDLVPLTPRHSIQARLLCHFHLTSLPPDALARYRGRVDAQARTWLE